MIKKSLVEGAKRVHKGLRGSYSAPQLRTFRPSRRSGRHPAGFQKFPRKFASPTENGTTSKFPKEFLEFLGKPNGRIPMTVCSLGKDAGWDDPTKIPIEDIIELWREQSSKGRYANSLYWGAAGLLDALATAQNT